MRGNIGDSGRASRFVLLAGSPLRQVVEMCALIKKKTTVTEFAKINLSYQKLCETEKKKSRKSNITAVKKVFGGEPPQAGSCDVCFNKKKNYGYGVCKD